MIRKNQRIAVDESCAAQMLYLLLMENKTTKLEGFAVTSFQKTTVVLAALPLAACGPSVSDIADSKFDSYKTGEVSTDYRISLAENTVQVTDVGTVAYAVGIPKRSSRVVAAAAYAANPNVGAVQTSGSATYTGDFGYAVAYDVEQYGGGVSETTVENSGQITLTADFGQGTLKGASNGLIVDGVINGQTLGGTVITAYVKEEVEASAETAASSSSGSNPAATQISKLFDLFNNTSTGTVTVDSDTSATGTDTGTEEETAQTAIAEFDDMVEGTLDGEIGTTGAVGIFHGNTKSEAMAGGFVLVRD